MPLPTGPHTDNLECCHRSYANMPRWIEEYCLVGEQDQGKIEAIEEGEGWMVKICASISRDPALAR